MSAEIDLLIVDIRWPPETFIQRKLMALAQKGVRIAVASSLPSRQARQFSLPGVRLIRLPHHDDNVLLRVLQAPPNVLRTVASPGGLNKLAFLWRYATKGSPRAWLNRLLSAAVLMRLKPKIVHFEWNSAAISYSEWSEIWDCPQVVSCRGSQINVRPHVPGGEEYIQSLRWTLQKAAAVHCVSSDIELQARNYGLDPAKAWVIRPAVDPEFFYPLKERRPKDAIFCVISVGALIWKKGYEYALVAVRELVERGVAVHYEIIGDGPERQRVLYTIDDLGLTEQVRLIGKLSPVEVRDRLQQADAFLLSSHSEGISNAVLEAMACGLPVVTTDCGGMREAVTDGVEGFVVPVRDPAAMAEALQKLASDADLRAAMGARARERILREFTLEQQAQQFLALYTHVMQSKAT